MHGIDWRALRDTFLRAVVIGAGVAVGAVAVASPFVLAYQMGGGR